MYLDLYYSGRVFDASEKPPVPKTTGPDFFQKKPPVLFSKPPVLFSNSLELIFMINLYVFSLFIKQLIIENYDFFQDERFGGPISVSTCLLRVLRTQLLHLLVVYNPKSLILKIQKYFDKFYFMEQY